MIIAHHRPDLLQELIAAIDDPRNDIYVHVDRKSDMDISGIHTSDSELIWIPRIDVNWGGYSQVECAMRLIEAAAGRYEYAYYHLLTGVTYPLRSQDEIHDFFDKHNGLQALEFDHRYDYIERVKYYWIFNEAGQYGPWTAVVRRQIYRLFVRLQKKLGVDRFKRYGLTIGKGLAYWSITHNLVLYILDNKKLIQSIFKHSFCGDEQFVHTLVRNSRFRDLIIEDEYNCEPSMRLSTWDIEDVSARKGHCFQMEDLPVILDSDAMFALKFEGPDGMQLIEEIKKRRLLRGSSD